MYNTQITWNANAHIVNSKKTIEPTKHHKEFKCVQQFARWSPMGISREVLCDMLKLLLPLMLLSLLSSCCIRAAVITEVYRCKISV